MMVLLPVKKFEPQDGISLVEIMVVIVIIGIVTAMALMQSGSADAQFKRQNIARELKVALERARFDSVKRRAQASPDMRANVVITATSFTLTTDINQNGTFDANDSVVTDFAPQDIVIAGNGGVTLPVAVAYNQRGEATASNGGGQVNPIFLICNVTCSNPTAADSNIVLVTPTGTVNLLAGGSGVPTFAAPNVSTVPTGTGVTNIARVP